MFYTMRYLNAVSKLGLVRGVIDEYEEQWISRHELKSKKFGCPPIEAAVEIYGMMMGNKLQAIPKSEIQDTNYFDIAISANHLIKDWVYKGKLDIEVAERVVNEIANIIDEKID